MSYRNSFESYEASDSRGPYTSDRIRERSVLDRKPFTPIGDEVFYRAEQSKLYPPDGYYKKLVRTKLPNGKEQSHLLKIDVIPPTIKRTMTRTSQQGTCSKALTPSTIVKRISIDWQKQVQQLLIYTRGQP